MEAIRKIVTVKNHQINITLPEDFYADEVEVIILPKQDDFEIPQWQINEVRERTERYLKSPNDVTDIEDFLKEIEDEL